MNKITFSTLALALLLATGCNTDGNETAANNTETNSQLPSYNKAGITFNHPADWKITESEQDELGVFIACEKVGDNESGIVIMTILDDNNFDTKDMITGYLQDLTADSLFLDFTATPIEPAKYNTIDAIAANYVVTDEGYLYNGRAYGFKMCGKAILLIEQSSADDAEESTIGFNAIRQSLACATL